MADNMNELLGPKAPLADPSPGGKPLGLLPINANPNFSHWPFFTPAPVKAPTSLLPNKTGFKPALKP